AAERTEQRPADAAAPVARQREHGKDAEPVAVDDAERRADGLAVKLGQREGRTGTNAQDEVLVDLRHLPKAALLDGDFGPGLERSRLDARLDRAGVVGAAHLGQRR